MNQRASTFAIAIGFLAAAGTGCNSRDQSAGRTRMVALDRPRIDTSACVANFEVDHMPEMDPASDRRQHVPYPENLRGANIQGTVRARFVVDTAGRPEMSSLHIVQSSHRYFSDAVTKALPGFHYLPATKSGKPVRCWTEQSFEFTLTS